MYYDHLVYIGWSQSLIYSWHIFPNHCGQVGKYKNKTSTIPTPHTLKYIWRSMGYRTGSFVTRRATSTVYLKYSLKHSRATNLALFFVPIIHYLSFVWRGANVYPRKVIGNTSLKRRTNVLIVHTIAHCAAYTHNNMVVICAECAQRRRRL